MHSLIITALCLLLGSTLAALDPKETSFVDGTVLVGFRPGVTRDQQSTVIREAGVVERRVIGTNVHVLTVAPGSVMRSVAELQRRTEVQYAEPDFLQTPSGVPNDPSFNLQWGFQNTGQNILGLAGTMGADEHVVPAWNVTTGSSSIVVAMTDTGIQYNHPDLAPNVWSNPGGLAGCPAGTHGYNVLNASCDPLDDDSVYGGHGSHVAGIIGAATNNGIGVAGINWQSTLLEVKWVTASNSGATSDLITALDWIIRAKQAGVNIRVVNDSPTWPGTAYSQALSDEIDLLGANDILFVTPAGNTQQNDDTTPRYPCSYNRPNEICVGASDQYDHLASWSCWGATTVKLVAPGVNIYSTLKDVGSYGYISGSSMSAAQVSGAAALLLSTGYKNVTDLRTAILNAVDVLPALNGLVSTSGRLNMCKLIPGCSGAPVNTALPVISGTPQQGNTLTASNGTWNGSPTSFSYQWQRCDNTGANCSVAGGTTNSYALGSADVGSTIRAMATATNSNGSSSATSAQTAVIAAATASLAITTSSLPGGTVGVSYSATLTASGGTGTYTWSVASGSLPTNLTLSSAGVISGTPSAAATSGFTVQVKDGSGTTTSKGLSITISPAVVSNGIALVQAASVEGSGVSSLSQLFPQNNSAGNLVIAFVRMSTIAQSVSMSDSVGNTYSEAVAQTQTTDGHQIHVFYAKNVAGGSNTVTATFSGTNKHPWLSVYEYSGLSTSAPLDKTSHSQGSGAAASSGSTGTASSANELVFAGLGMVNNSNAAVTAGSGYTLLQQDTGDSRAATEALSVSATGQFAGTFSLSSSTNWSAVVATFSAAAVSSPNPPSITTTSLPGGTVGVGYSATLAATGGSGSYTWSVMSGSLPGGLSLNTSTGVISGTPSASGTSGFTVQVKDSNAQTATQTLSISVSPAVVSGSITLVQAASGEGTGVASLSRTFASANAAGNFIIAFVRMSTATQTITVTDSLGNAYTDAVMQAQTSDGHQIHVFYAKNVKGGANTVTATFSGANNHPWLAVYEYSGLSTTAPLDQTAHAQGSGTSVSTGNTAVTGSASELVFAGLGMVNNTTAAVTAGSGYSIVQQDTNTSRAANEVRTTSSTGAFAGTFSLSSSTNWSAVVATFR